MPIQGKTITVPEQEFNLYWITELRIQSLDPTKGPSIRATLRPYYLDGGDVVFAQGHDITFTIEDLNVYGETHAGVSTVIDAVLSAVEAAAKERDLI